MSGQTNGEERNGPPPELVVVNVTDSVNPTLAGRGDISYQSPPLPREEAQTLVRLLLGRGELPSANEQRWTCAIAGGRRSVTLTPRPSVADSIVSDR